MLGASLFNAILLRLGTMELMEVPHQLVQYYVVSMTIRLDNLPEVTPMCP